jgi:hypothetical protein
MDEREFRLGEPFFPYFRRVALGRFLPFLVIAVVAAVLIPSSREEMDPAMMLVFGGILAVVVGFGGWRGLKQQEASLRELRIRLDEGSIRRTQPGLPEIAIPKEQIRRIVRVPGKGLTPNSWKASRWWRTSWRAGIPSRSGSRDSRSG